MEAFIVFVHIRIVLLYRGACGTVYWGTSLLGPLNGPEEYQIWMIILFLLRFETNDVEIRLPLWLVRLTAHVDLETLSTYVSVLCIVKNLSIVNHIHSPTFTKTQSTTWHSILILFTHRGICVCAEQIIIQGHLIENIIFCHTSVHQTNSCSDEEKKD